MTVGILDNFEKQPGETKVYGFDYTDFLTAHADTIASIAISAEPGVTLGASSFLGGRVKVLVSGGTDGTGYKITCRATTTGGLVEEADIQVAVKET